MLLIKSVEDCPIDIPGREKKLVDQYFKFMKTSEDTVSVQAPVELERLKEIDLDLESDEKKKKILINLIKYYTASSFEFPDQKPDLYLISSLKKCPCCGGSLIIKRRYKKVRTVVAYCTSGPRLANVYTKNCPGCSASVHSSYIEYEERVF